MKYILVCLFTLNNKYVMSSHVARLHSTLRHQDCKIFSDFLGFEVLVGGCLELKDITLEILKTCLIHKCFEGSINSVYSILVKLYSINLSSPSPSPNIPKELFGLDLESKILCAIQIPNPPTEKFKPINGMEPRACLYPRPFLKVLFDLLCN